VQIGASRVLVADGAEEKLLRGESRVSAGAVDDFREFIGDD
jgi:hypothetical protein